MIVAATNWLAWAATAVAAPLFTAVMLLMVKRALDYHDESHERLEEQAGQTADKVQEIVKFVNKVDHRVVTMAHQNEVDHLANRAAVERLSDEVVEMQVGLAKVEARQEEARKYGEQWAEWRERLESYLRGEGR